MDVSPTRDQEAFIRQALESGRIARPEDAVTEAMAMWEDRERRRAELLADLDTAEASLVRGAGVAITPTAVEGLAASIKDRGRSRLAAERTARR